MSKLSDKFAQGRKALEERASQSPEGASAPAIATERPPGPLHGSVTTMKIDMLSNEVRTLRAGKPTVRIPAGEVRPSAWKNRHEDSFQTKHFEELKAEIQSAGGNIQPIKVRPIAQVENSPYKYEIVFGRRRHRACLDLEMDVLAFIEDLDDKHLFIEMDRENRQREDLRPYEQGLMYADALDKGLFASLRKLAEEVGADATNVSKAVSLARFPGKVIAAFVSPLDIQYRWVSDLKGVLETDPDAVLARAAAIAKARCEGKSITSPEAFATLVGKTAKTPASAPRQVKVGKKVLLISEIGGKVSFQMDLLDKDKLTKIEKFIAVLMGE